LTARALTAQEEGMRARQVWLDVARIHLGQGDALARVEALKAAQACGPDDPAIAAELGHADRAAERFRLRLEDQPWAAPTEEASGRLVFRAQVQARYGFPDRGVATLRGAPAELRETLALRVALGELLSQVGDKAAAAAELAQVQAPDTTARLQLAQRLSVLRDEPDPLQAGAEEELVDDGSAQELVDDGDELIDDGDELFDDGPAFPPSSPGSAGEDEELIDDDTEPPTNRPEELPAPAPPPAASLDEDEALGDEAAAAGRWDEALKLWRKALMRQPANTELLFKVSEALEQRSRGAAASPAPAARALPEAPAPAPPPQAAPIPPPPAPPPPAPRLVAPPAPLSLGASPDFSDIFGNAPEQAEEALTGALLDARAWMMVGRPEQALRLLDGSRDLGPRLWAARARRQAGDLAGAASALGAAIAEAADSDPTYPEALFEFAALNAATGKLRAARRALDELEDLDPNWRPADLAVLRRGLELLG
jgi:tetratricopeptide (TPR) repeat protein